MAEKKLPFDPTGLDAQAILVRAEDMAQRYEARIKAQSDTIARLVADLISLSEGEEVNVEDITKWRQYEWTPGGITSTAPDIYGPDRKPQRERMVYEVAGPWSEYN